MNSKFGFVALLVIVSALATNGQLADNNDGVSQVSSFLSNSLNRLRNQFDITVNDSRTRLQLIHGNLTNFRQNLANYSSDAASDVMGRLSNLTERLNTVLRERVSNDKNLVDRLYQMISNATSNGTDQSPQAVRQAFTRATQAMADNYSDLANSSIHLAEDLLSRGRQMFDAAMLRAGNDTNRAVVAANNAVQAIKNNAPAINQTYQQMASNMAQRVQDLSKGMRDLMNRSSATVQSGVQTVTSPEFKQKAEQTFQNLMSSINELRDSLNQMSQTVVAKTEANPNPNPADNEIDVIGRASQALAAEYEAVRQQIQALRSQNNNN